jgi:FtsH-binding integral membrane protein
MVPFAKLQATMAALGASALLVAGVFAYGRTWRERCAGAGIVCVAGVVIPLGLVVFFTANGALEYFWTSYIQNALAYQGSGYRGSSALKMLGMILFAKPPMRPEDFLWFAGGWLVLVVVSILALVWSRQKSAPWRSWSFLAYTLILLGLAVWTVTAPQRNYPHYLLFLPVPMGILVMALSGVLSAKVASRPSVWRAFAIGLFLLVGAGPMIYARLKSPNSWAGLAQKWSSEKPGVISQKILQASGGEGRLCVWGYNPTYYSETGMVQATRLSTSSALFNDNALRPFFLGSYLEDLRRNRPKVFVDAVAPEQFVMMTKREEHGHEVVPEVRDFVASNYELFDAIDSVRIYRWREN